MRARLGFAIATAVDPDILLLDEVLQTGDEVFREKSRQRIISILTAAKAVVLVTHDMTWVTEFCTRAILIEDGRVTLDGSPEEVVRTHREHSRGTPCGAAGADRADAPGRDRHHRVRGAPDGGARQEGQARHRRSDHPGAHDPGAVEPVPDAAGRCAAGAGRARSPWARGPRRIRSRRCVLAWLRAGMPRVIHLHWVHRYLEPVRGRERWAARRTLLGAASPAPAWCADRLDAPQHRATTTVTGASWRCCFHRQLVELCDAVICHCAATRQLAIEAYGLPRERAGAAARRAPRQLRRLVPGHHRTATRRAPRSAWASTDRVFLFIGQVRRYKGVEDLLRGLPAASTRRMPGWSSPAGRPDHADRASRSRPRPPTIRA